MEALASTEQTYQKLLSKQKQSDVSLCRLLLYSYNTYSVPGTNTFNRSV